MYTDPKNVVSPKSRWSLSEVLCDTGQGGFSAATGTWDKQACVAIRWNGDDEGTSGNPSSHGNATWFIVPGELEKVVCDEAKRLADTTPSVKVEFTRPNGWDVGVFLVTIEVLPPLAEQMTTACLPIVFDLPNLPKRLFRPLDSAFDFFVPPRGPGETWRGKLIDGKWSGIVQTNGIREEENPVPIEVLRSVLKASVVFAVSSSIMT